jgi:hypothetical protein
MKSRVPPARHAREPNGTLLWCALLLTGSLFVGGCANIYEVKVDALAKPKANDAISYMIRTANPAIAEDSLRHQEAVGYVRTALSGKGMYETNDVKKADLVVDLDYGVGPPQMHRETVSDLVDPALPGDLRYEREAVGVDNRGNVIYQNVAVSEPPLNGSADQRDVVVTTVVYEKHLRLSARENKPAADGHPPAEIWTVDVTSEGESHDLRKALPVLAAATIDYVGKDSHGLKVIHLKDTDQDLAFVRKGM